MNESSGVQIVIIVLTSSTLTLPMYIQPYEKIGRYLRFDFYVTEYRVKKILKLKIFLSIFQPLRIYMLCSLYYLGRYYLCGLKLLTAGILNTQRLEFGSKTVL